jgi:adenosylcobyric acid synthase
VLRAGKTVRHAAQRFGALTGAWSALSNVPVAGYEIHSGRTVQHPAMAAKGDVAREVMAGLAWQVAGNVLGVYLHGLFEDAAARALFGADAPALDAVFDGLADAVERAFAPGVLDASFSAAYRRTPACDTESAPWPARAAPGGFRSAPRSARAPAPARWPAARR